MSSSKEQVAALQKKLAEVQMQRDLAEKAKEEAERAKREAEVARAGAEQQGYELGVVEIEESLRAEVPAMCRIYCAQTWTKALDQARVEVSFELRKAKKIYYPPAIRASDLPPTQGKAVSSFTDPARGSQS